MMADFQMKIMRQLRMSTITSSDQTDSSHCSGTLVRQNTRDLQTFSFSLLSFVTINFTFHFPHPNDFFLFYFTVELSPCWPEVWNGSWFLDGATRSRDTPRGRYHHKVRHWETGVRDGWGAGRGRQGVTHSRCAPRGHNEMRFTFQSRQICLVGYALLKDTCNT